MIVPRFPLNKNCILFISIFQIVHRLTKLQEHKSLYPLTKINILNYKFPFNTKTLVLFSVYPGITEKKSLKHDIAMQYFSAQETHQL